MNRYRHPAFLAVFLVVWLLPSVGQAQYLLNRSLQIDLRSRGPAAPQRTFYPYGYSSNLIVTGNVRYGKSFRGSTPFGQLGSELGTLVPSAGLDTFRRDSISIGDILRGHSYGAIIPFYGRSTQVTSSRTAGTRFMARPQEAPPERLMTLGRPLDLLALQRASMRPLQPLTSAQPVTPYPWYDYRLGPGVGGPPDLLDPSMFFMPPRTEKDAGREGAPREATLPTLPSLSKGPTAEEMTQTGPFESDAGKVPLPGIQKDSGREEAEGEEGPDAKDKRILLPLLGGAGRQLHSYESYMREGHKFFRDGHYGRAARMYNAARTLDRDRPDAYLAQGHAYLASGKYHQAALALQRAVIMYPDWVDSDMALPDVFARPEDLQEREKEIGEYLAKSPNVTTYNFLLGYIYWFSDRRDDGESLFRRIKGGSKGTGAKAARVFLNANNSSSEE
ncbi:MAG: tetratricopeptide repeat protein [Planctomycetia bacterium]|nr:tetratricopeptide repeat protein [Planctomycetia bacterium]